jgi:hypothetical protein
MSKVTEADATAVETLIDRIGLEETLNLIAAICVGKSFHILASYDDKGLSDAWRYAGDVVSTAADTSEVKEVSL